MSPGLPVLVELVACAEESGGKGGSEAATKRLLSLIGLECIVQIFTHLENRRNDFCRLFAKLGLLPHLSVAFLNMLNRCPPLPHPLLSICSPPHI